MIGKLLSFAIDFFLACTLIALVQIAFEENKTFFQEHTHSIIHELDRDFIDQLYTAQRHLHALAEHPEWGSSQERAIIEIKNRLARIEQDYKKNSSGLALLGPIGTAAIVMKEEKLNKDLLALINEMSMLLHTITQQDETFQPALTIDSGLNSNKEFIKTMVM